MFVPILLGLAVVLIIYIRSLQVEKQLKVGSAGSGKSSGQKRKR